tara:strand:+ start:464 stop:2626 length:2163 start_codon:yes stop_codon:yes gene_type:complete
MKINNIYSIFDTNKYFQFLLKFFGNKIVLYLNILVIFICFILLHIYSLNIYELLKVFFFNLFYIFIPGLLFYNLLKFKGDFIEKFTFSITLGLFFITLQYILFFLIDQKFLLKYLNFFISLFYVFFIFSFKDIKNNFLQIPHVLWSLTLLLIIISFFGLSLSAPLPNLVSGIGYNQDKLWSLGLIQALTKNFPPVDPRLSGNELKYHYFMFIYLASISFVTDIIPFKIYFYYSQFFKIIFFVFSIFLFGKKFFNSEKKGLIFSILFLFSSCLSFVFGISSDWGLFRNENIHYYTAFPNGYMQAMTFSLIISTIFIDYFRNNKINLNLAILFFISYLLIAGTKAPNSALILGVLNAMFLINLFIKKINFQSFLLLVLITNIIFLTFYYYLYMSHSIHVMKPELVIGSFVRLQSEYKVETTLVITILKNLYYFFLIPFHMFFVLPLGIFFMIFFYKEVLNFNRQEFDIIYLIFFSLLGIFISNFIYIPFNGNQYFFQAVSPYLIILGLYFFWKYKNLINKNVNLFIVLIISISLISSLSISIRQIVKGTVGLSQIYISDNFNNCNYNLNNFSEKFKKQYYSNCYDWNRITKLEYEAMTWIKNNTKTDSIILSNRLYNHINSKNNIKKKYYSKFFYYSTFSNRNYFLEGYSYWIPEKLAKERLEILNQIYYSASDDIKYNLLNKNEINYIVVSEFIDPDLNLDNKFLKLVFKNDHIKVYKFNV